MTTKETRLAAALDDCLSRLNGGASLGDCLAAYPHFADELSPMLQSVGLLKGFAKSIPTPTQINSMQASFLSQVHAPKSISIFANPMALAMMAAAVTAVVIGLGAFFSVNQNQAASPIAIGEPPTEVAVSAFTELDTETATTTPTETTTTTVTSTQTETETVTVTTTETGTVTTTATEAETETVTVTEAETTTTTATATETEAETVTATATETGTETMTATPTATQTATRTPTRTPTATRTATAVPQVAQAVSVPQPESNASQGGATGSSTSGGNTSGSSASSGGASRPAEGIPQPLGSAATQCILANSCLLLDRVANTGGVKAGDATTLIFTVNQREIPVDIDYDQPGEAACEMGYCVLFQSDGTIFWFTRGTSDNISHIQFWDFSDDTDRDGIPDVQDLCPLDARDRCTPKPVILTTICHIPLGNPDEPRTIRIAEPGVEAHLDHGDTLGACPQTPGQGGG